MKTLVIGDAHCDVAEGPERFEWAGRLALDYGVDNIVSIGDWTSFDSITRWSAGKPLLQEGRRLIDDIDAGTAGMASLMKPIVAYNKRAAKNNRKRFKPRKEFLLGNHDARFHIYCEIESAMVGMLRDYGDSFCKAESYGWNVTQYGRYTRIGGVGFTHIPFSRLGKPLGSEHIAYQAVLQEGSSIVFGHTHRRQEHSVAVHGENEVKFGISCGKYFEHVPGYISQPEKTDWWTGLLVLHHVDTDKGHVDCEWIDIRRVKEKYA